MWEGRTKFGKCHPPTLRQRSRQGSFPGNGIAAFSVFGGTSDE